MQVPTSPTGFTGEGAFLAVFLSWFLAQMAKVTRGVITQKKFDFRWIFDTGGMPSSHSSTVTSMATVIGLYYGFGSMPFLMALVFSIITMFDAAGVRRNVGKQARILNKIVDEYNQRGHVLDTQVRELLGHTPIEVFGGAFLGIVVALLICG